MTLKEKFGERLKENEPLRSRTTFRLGGPAKYFLAAETAEEALAAAEAAKADDLPVFVLGGGSNILVSDAGFPGLVIVPSARAVKIEGETVRADAGAPLALLVNLAAASGLGGLDWAAGIPGTVGGALRGNAGAYGGEMSGALVSVDAINLETGERRTLGKDECSYGYRDSMFKRGPWLIWSALFRLPPGEKEALKSRIAELIALRRGLYPADQGNAGCVFKNHCFADPAELPEKVRSALPPKYAEFKKVPAAWLIEQLSLKGKIIGGAQVYPGHANFIVNTGPATASDVFELIVYVKMRVREEWGIALEEEVQLVGF